MFKPDQLSEDFQNFFYRQSFEFGTPINSMKDAWDNFFNSEITTKMSNIEKVFMFYSIDPTKNFKVIGQYGIQEHFDLDKEIKSPNELIPFIHPKQLPFYLALSQAVISFTLEDLVGKVGLNKELSGYQVTVPMKLRDGKYYRLEQLTQPISLDRQGRVVAVLNRYRVLGEYQGEALQPYIYTNKPIENSDRISKKFSLKARTFLKKIYEVQNILFPFSPALAKSLIYYSRKENYGQTADEEAKKRNKSPRTCTDYRSKIIGKAKELTDKRFPDVFTVIDYFVEQGFLPGRNIFIPVFHKNSDDT